MTSSLAQCQAFYYCSAAMLLLVSTLKVDRAATAISRLSAVLFIRAREEEKEAGAAAATATAG